MASGLPSAAVARRKLWNAQWVRLRRAFAATLPAPCGRCGQPIQPTDAWHLAHRVPRSQGGPDSPSNVEPWHARCNLAEAPRLAWQAIRRARGVEAARRRWTESNTEARMTPVPQVTPTPPTGPVEKSRIF